MDFFMSEFLASSLKNMQKINQEEQKERKNGNF